MDAANRLIGADVDGVASSFKVNGLGQRTETTVASSTTEYVLDTSAGLRAGVAGGLPEVIVATTGGASTRYVQIQGQVLAQNDSGTWAYVAPDALGSVRQLADTDGHVTLAQHYDPYGVLLEASGVGESEFGYTGEWWDSYTNQLFLRARYYDPMVGRFLAIDRLRGDLSKPQTLNGWSYADGDPVNLADPTGLYSIKEIKGFFYNAPTYLHVLSYFEPGRPLEGRWGWLEVLREAEDGDRLIVYDTRLNYCTYGDLPRLAPSGVNEYPREDIGGAFQKVSSQLAIGGVSHFQVALEGHRYKLERDTHCMPAAPHLGRHYEYCDELVSHFEPKAYIFATKKYMGLRRDEALFDLRKFLASLGGIITPKMVKDWGELVGI